MPYNEISPALREKIIYMKTDCDTKYIWADDKFFIPIYSQTQTEGDFKYVIDNDQVTILGLAEDAEINDELNILNIPGTINGHTVSKISDNAFINEFKDNSAIKNVQIPDSCTEIGQNAFKGCTNLESINLPEGITKIKKDTFNGCKSLNGITIPNSVVEIGWGAFSETGLTNIEIPSSVTKIDAYAFYECNKLTDVLINEGVTEIGGAAFSKCINIGDILIPKTVTKIGVYAFNECWCYNNEGIIIFNRTDPIDYDECSLYNDPFVTIKVPKEVQKMYEECFALFRSYYNNPLITF